jgi:hypothetical protein
MITVTQGCFQNIFPRVPQFRFRAASTVDKHGCVGEICLGCVESDPLILPLDEKLSLDEKFPSCVHSYFRHMAICNTKFDIVHSTKEARICSRSFLKRSSAHGESKPGS